MVEKKEALESDKDNNVNMEAKIVAPPFLEDDHARVPAHPTTHGSVGRLVAKVHKKSPVSPISVDRSKLRDDVEFRRAQIDTAAPFESVKAAVSKFGGIVDWKAHRVKTVERRKFIGQELEKARDEIPFYKKQSEAAEEAKNHVVKELDDTRRLIEELKLNLERAHRDEQQAKQDSELAKLRVEELEKGIAAESSFAAKAQLEVAKARHAAAVSELKNVKDELEQLRIDYTLWVSEKDSSVKNAVEAVSILKEIEKSVEDSTIELITAKGSLEFAHAAHLEAEEHRIQASMRKEQDTLNWEKDLKQAEEGIKKLNQKIFSSKDLKTKFDAAAALLQDLKSEMAAYMESKLKLETGEDELEEPKERTRGDVEVAVTAVKNELEEVKINIAKVTNEVGILKAAATSLRLELEQEKSELAAIRQREGTASIAVESLQAEMRRTKSQIALVRVKEREENEKLLTFSEQVMDTEEEENQVKVLAEKACKELQKAKEEAEKAKAGASAIENRLRAAQKEIDSAKASEKLALAAINALEESESGKWNEDSTMRIALTLEEYYELSKKAHEAEEEANIQVAEALSEIEKAKESELRCMDKLEEVNRELSERKSLLENALKKAEKAKQGKMDIEQELRKWRSEHEQRRKAGESVSAGMKLSKNPSASFEDKKESSNLTRKVESSSHQKHSSDSYTNNNKTEQSPDARVTKKKKKSFFPRMFMFLARKKGNSSKSS